MVRTGRQARCGPACRAHSFVRVSREPIRPRGIHAVLGQRERPRTCPQHLESRHEFTTCLETTTVVELHL